MNQRGERGGEREREREIVSRPICSHPGLSKGIITRLLAFVYKFTNVKDVKIRNS